MTWLWAALIVILLFGFVIFRGAPYVPSRRREIQVAFTTLYPLGENDLLVDIGSGDGVVLREAARYGAKAVGYELNPILVGISKLLSRQQRLVTVYLKDFWFAQLPKETTVVYVFGESRDIEKMAQKIQQEAIRLQKDLYLISYGFDVPSLTLYKKEGAYFLYRLLSLQSATASV